MFSLFGFVGLLFLLYWVATLSNRVAVLEQKLKTQKLSEPTLVKTELSHLPEAVSMPATNPVTPAKIAEKNIASDSNILAKVGVTALVLGLGFFFKYSIDQGWISEFTRVAIGIAVATLMIALGVMWKEKYDSRAGVLAGAGFVIAFFSFYAGFQIYHLYNYATAISLFLLVSIISVAIAYITNLRPLASVGLLGAFLAPVFFGIKAEQQSFIIIYLSILSTATLVLFFVRQWPELLVLSLVSSSFVYMSWILNFGKQNNSLLSWYFSLGMFALYILSACVGFRYWTTKSLIQKETESAVTILVFLCSLQYFVFTQIVLGMSYPELKPLAGVLAGVLLLFGYVFIDRLEKKNLNYTLSFMSAGFLSFAIIWQFKPNIEILALLALSAFGFFIGFLQKRTELRVASLCVSFLALGKAFLMPYGNSEELFLFNPKLALMFASTVELIVMAILFNILETTEEEKKIVGPILVISVLALWLGVSMDILHNFSGFDMQNVRNLIMTFWWIILSVATLISGQKMALHSLKQLALFLMILGIGKAFLYDVWALDTVYRIVAFIVLGVILLTVSFAYNKDKEKITKLFE
jgi:uncharacterized membrane protein